MIKAIRYLAGDPKGKHVEIHLTSYEKQTWAVRKLGYCWNKDGDWEEEPSPSNRDDAFIERTRFSFDKACQEAQNALDAAGEDRPSGY